jgi:hypothetical protein
MENTNDRRLASAQRTLPHHQRATVPSQRGGNRRGIWFGSYNRGRGGRGGRGGGGRIPEEFSMFPNTDFLAVCLPFTVSYSYLA